MTTKIPQADVLCGVVVCVVLLAALLILETLVLTIVRVRETTR